MRPPLQTLAPWLACAAAAYGTVTGQPQLDGRGLPAEPTISIERSAAFVVIEDGNHGGVLADRVSPLLARWGRPCGSFDTQPVLDGGIGFSVRLQ